MHNIDTNPNPHSNIINTNTNNNNKTLVLSAHMCVRERNIPGEPWLRGAMRCRDVREKQTVMLLLREDVKRKERNKERDRGREGKGYGYGG
jgi:hypothetical protein